MESIPFGLNYLPNLFSKTGRPVLEYLRVRVYELRVDHFLMSAHNKYIVDD